MTFNNDCKELKLRAAPGGKMTMTFDTSLSMKSVEKTRKAKGFGRLKDPLLRRSLAGNYCYHSPKASFLWSQITTFLCSSPGKISTMTEPGLERIRLHLENIVGERNSFTQPKHLENTAQYISGQFEAMGLKVTRKTVEFEGAQSQKTYKLR